MKKIKLPDHKLIHRTVRKQWTQ